MKRLSMQFFFLILALLIVLSACSNEKTSSENTTEEIKPIVTEAGSFPITEKKTTIKILVKGNSLVQDFKTNKFTKELEQKTNVHIDWEVLPEQGAEQKLNLILSSGDLPDVIMDAPITPAQLMIYGKNGTFLALNDLIDKYGVETKKIFQQLPIVKDSITAPDGNIYALPQVNACYHCSMPQKLWVYKPWLDKLQLKVPTTTDEFYNMLKAFKEKDPNGNGKADEIPLAGTPQSYEAQVDGYLISPFIYSGNSNHMILDNGKIDVVYNKPQWKEALMWLHKLNKEGLLASESFIQDGNQFLKMGEHPGDPILGAGICATQGCFSNSRSGDYVAIPPLKGPEGNQVTQYLPNPVTRPAEFVITKNAKHPDVAFRLADALYNEAMTMRAVLGIEGKQWRKAKEGELGFNGKQAKYYLIPGKPGASGVQNSSWDQTGPSLRTKEFRDAQAVGEDKFGLALNTATKELYEPYKASEDQIVPTLFFTDQQSNELSQLEKTINDYVKEMTARFVTGDEDIEKGWGTYIQTLDGMNLKRYLEIYQEAYDAKYKE
ncbi:ABC transporter substrate-binding protein [Metabacillus sp. Hm71]|uniref:ABC transporter substrate-binding protein n=1 Tax=Metabacillus sp. Hm71 TaxID=3450743 RepID=UPI003F424DBB